MRLARRVDASGPARDRLAAYMATSARCISVRRPGRARGTGQCRCWRRGRSGARSPRSGGTVGQHPLGDDDRLLPVAPRQAGWRIVAAQAGHQVGLAEPGPEPRVQVLEDLVAEVVAEGVVDILEPVQVDPRAAAGPPTAGVGSATAASIACQSRARLGRPVSASCDASRRSWASAPRRCTSAAATPTRMLRSDSGAVHIPPVSRAMTAHRRAASTPRRTSGGRCWPTRLRPGRAWRGRPPR